LERSRGIEGKKKCFRGGASNLASGGGCHLGGDRRAIMPNPERKSEVSRIILGEQEKNTCKKETTRRGVRWNNPWVLVIDRGGGRWKEKGSWAIPKYEGIDHSYETLRKGRIRRVNEIKKGDEAEKGGKNLKVWQSGNLAYPEFKGMGAGEKI